MKKIKFKKFLVLFSLLICVFCMTACSSSNGTISTASAKTELKQQQLDASEAYLVDWVKDMITYLDKNDSAKITADAEAAQSLTMVNNKLYIVDQSGISVKTIAFYNSWNSTRDELGALKSINEINVELNSKTGELCTITVDTSYEKNDKCTFEFVINDDYTPKMVCCFNHIIYIEHFFFYTNGICLEDISGLIVSQQTAFHVV